MNVRVRRAQAIAALVLVTARTAPAPAAPAPVGMPRPAVRLEGAAPALPQSPPLTWSRWERFDDGEGRRWLSACALAPWSHGYVSELGEVLEGRMLPLVRSAVLTLAPDAGPLLRQGGDARAGGVTAVYRWTGREAGALRLWIVVGTERAEACAVACADRDGDDGACARAVASVELEAPPDAPAPSAALRALAFAVRRPRPAGAAAGVLAACAACAWIALRRRPRRGAR